MHRSPFHRTLAALTVLLMLSPYIPLPHGEMTHEHCIHCTGRYCTKGKSVCTCDHERRATEGPHDGNSDGHHGEAPGGATATSKAAAKAGATADVKAAARAAANPDTPHGTHTAASHHQAIDATPPTAHTAAASHAHASTPPQSHTAGSPQAQIDESPEEHTVPPAITVVIEPCGSAPTALLIPSLDEYVPFAAVPPAPLLTDLPSPGGSYHPLDGRIAHDIFRPPISGA